MSSNDYTFNLLNTSDFFNCRRLNSSMVDGFNLLFYFIETLRPGTNEEFSASAFASFFPRLREAALAHTTWVIDADPIVKACAFWYPYDIIFNTGWLLFAPVALMCLVVILYFVLLLSALVALKTILILLKIFFNAKKRLQ